MPIISSTWKERARNTLSARLGDTLVIRTWIENTTRFRIVVRQIVQKKGEPRDYLVTAKVTLVTASPNGELMEVPREFHEL
ncbi:MAG: hypothetical protein P8182_00225 [Deltaproteobacteria bacterium]